MTDVMTYTCLDINIKFRDLIFKLVMEINLLEFFLEYVAIR